MSRIENIQQLRFEITRLQSAVKNHEEELRNDLDGIREDLKPANLAWSILSSITGIKIDRSEFFRDGFAFGLSILIQRFFLKTEKKVEHFIYDFVDSVFQKLKHYLEKFTNPEARRQERQEPNS